MKQLMCLVALAACGGDNATTDASTQQHDAKPVDGHSNPGNVVTGTLGGSSFAALDAVSNAVMANGFDFGGDDSEILGDNRKRSELCGEHAEEIRARTFDPCSVDGGGFSSWNLEGCFESAEVIEAHYIDDVQCFAESAQPPIVILTLQDLPTVDGVSP